MAIGTHAAAISNDAGWRDRATRHAGTTTRVQITETPQERMEMAKDIALATLLGTAMFGISIAVVLSVVKFF